MRDPHVEAVYFKVSSGEDISAVSPELGVPVAVEVSRSGNGAHAWIFFEHSVPASEVRLLGSAIISHTCERTRQLTLGSYDRKSGGPPGSARL